MILEDHLEGQLREADKALSALGPLPYPLPLGPLAPIVAGAFSGMGRGDWIVAGPRERIGAVLRGASVERLREAREGARPYRLAPGSGAPGNRALHAVGIALSSGGPVLCFLGNASAATGAFHEALNAAALSRARVIFLLVLHDLDSDEAPIGRQLFADPLALAAAFDIASQRVAPTEAAIREAVSTARSTEGPTLLVVHLPRS